MSEQQLREAYALMKSGDKRQAGQMVQDVLKIDPKNVSAWWMMANLLDDEARILKSLERLLSLSPEHKGARNMMKKLKPDAILPEIVEQPKPMNWEKLDAREKPKAKNEDVIAAEKRVTQMAIYAGVFLVVGVIVAVVYQVLPMLSSSPQKTVVAYLEAVSTFDIETIRGLTCSQYQADMDRAFAGVQPSSIGNMIGIEDLTFDFSGLTANILTQTATDATVQLGGAFSMSASGVSMAFDIDQLMHDYGGNSADMAINLVYENGDWRICEPVQ